MERAARNWVRQMVAQSPVKPLAPEAVWTVMEAQIGHGPLAVGRTRTVLDVIDRQLSDRPLADRRSSAALHSLRTAADAYLHREQASLKRAA